MAAMLPETAPSLPLPSPLEQLSFHVHLSSTAEHERPEAEGPLVHLSLQHFQDYVWVLVTEDATCAPGTVLRYAGPPAGPSGYLYEGGGLGSLPHLECDVLLGRRDDPLTNLTASMLAHVVRETGDPRPIEMFVCLAKTARLLKVPADRRQFITDLRAELKKLLREVAAQRQQRQLRAQELGV